MKSMTSAVVVVLFSGAAASAQLLAGFQTVTPGGINHLAFDVVQGTYGAPSYSGLLGYSNNLSIPSIIRLSPIPQPPPQPPVQPGRSVADDIHMSGVNPGTLVGHFRIAFHHFQALDTPLNAAIRLYANDASNSNPPPSAGGSAAQIGATIEVTNLPTGGTFIIDVENFSIAIPSPDLWLEVTYSDSFAIPILSDRAGPTIGSSHDLFGWNGANNSSPPMPQGLYNLGGYAQGVTPRGDFVHEVGIPSPGVLPVLAAGLLMRRRRR